MGTETFANGQVNYKAADGSTKNCLDSLDDDERYKYGCRCGCTAVFSGFGRDIKAAFKVGQSTFPAIQALAAGTNNVLYDASTGAVTVTTGGHTAIEGDIAEKMRQDFAEKIRPFVSDRYIKKAVFGLTDDEIDADHAENPEQMEDVKLSDRQPPAISDLVYSLATNEGPYTLVDYARKKIKLDDGSEHDVFCGIVRTDKGKHISIPLADLALHWAERPVVEPKKLRVGLMMVASSVIGSAIGIACYLFL